VDMGGMRRIAGFSYLPRRDGVRDGIVESYRFETSLDGTNWTTQLNSGRFGNMRNYPSLQEANFPPADVRFFRFTALEELGNHSEASAAEISVLPADTVAPR
jgi:hypothetical protein